MAGVPAGRKRKRRRYGSGSIYEKDGRWVAQVAVRGPEGQRRYRTKFCKSYAAASDALDALLEDYGEDRGQHEHETLARFLERWLAGLRLAPGTLRAYRQHVTLHIVPEIGGIEPPDLRRVDVERLIRALEAKGLGAGSVGNVVLTLSAALQSAVRDGTLTRNVARLAARPAVRREPVRAMPWAEARNILDAASKTEYGALVALLMGTGLRIGEALALDWRDVDLEAATVFIRRAKTPAGVRTVDMAPVAVAALKKLQKTTRRIGPEVPVFLGQRSHRRLTEGTATHAIPYLLVRAGLPRRHAHELRHGHATLLRAAGADMRLIADQLGHSSPEITARLYAHILPGERRAMVRRLGARLTERTTESGRRRKREA